MELRLYYKDRDTVCIYGPRDWFITDSNLIYVREERTNNNYWFTMDGLTEIREIDNAKS